MGKALSVLRRVNRPYAKGEKARQNSCHCWIRPAAGRDWGITRWRRRRRLHAFQPCRQAVLAIDHPAHVARAVRAQCFPARAAIGHRRYIGMVGAVHTNLLVAVTAAIGGTSGVEASTGWFSPWL